MNKVFAEANKRIDEALATSVISGKAKADEVTRYEALAIESQDKANKCLLADDLEGFRTANRAAVEAKTAAEAIRKHLSEGQRVMKDEEAEALDRQIMDELDKANKKYSLQIFEHLREAERLANELYDLMGEGHIVTKRLNTEVRHRETYLYSYNYFKPNIRELVADLNRLQYLRIMKEQAQAGRWTAKKK